MRISMSIIFIAFFCAMHFSVAAQTEATPPDGAPKYGVQLGLYLWPVKESDLTIDRKGLWPVGRIYPTIQMTKPNDRWYELSLFCFARNKNRTIIDTMTSMGFTGNTFLSGRLGTQKVHMALSAAVSQGHFAKNRILNRRQKWVFGAGFSYQNATFYSNTVVFPGSTDVETINYHLLLQVQYGVRVFERANFYTDLSLQIHTLFGQIRTDGKGTPFRSTIYDLNMDISVPFLQVGYLF